MCINCKWLTSLDCTHPAPARRALPNLLSTQSKGDNVRLCLVGALRSNHAAWLHFCSLLLACLLQCSAMPCLHSGIATTAHQLYRLSEQPPTEWDLPTKPVPMLAALAASQASNFSDLDVANLQCSKLSEQSSFRRVSNVSTRPSITATCAWYSSLPFSTPASLSLL